MLLDVDPPKLRRITVDGTLLFADRDVRLRTGGITVRGNVVVGSATHPFAHHAEIVLDGSSLAGGIVAVSEGGRLELHGLSRRSWTHLERTAPAGADEIVVSNDAGWVPGDSLVISSTSFESREAEEIAVARVDDTTLTLASPLRFEHWGTSTDGIDERAEVGLLTHNVVVRSEPAGAAAGRGGEIVVLRGGTFRASGVEFARLGRRAKLGRYPIHFHLAGDGSGSIVDGSSIHHSLNRCLTIHGTDRVTVSNNVAYDTVGHCFFLEDGAETKNVLDGNLGMRTRAAPTGEAILESDAQPATFWISNPGNVVTRNVAAGSDGAGFWYNLSVHPTGPSANPNLWPRRSNLGAFDANVAHSNATNGLFVDNLHNPPGVDEAPNYSPRATADFQHFTSYKNRRRGVWLRGTNLRVSDARVADNAIGVTFAGSDAILRGSLIVGETENQTGPPKPEDPAFPVRGFEFYDGRVGVESTRFRNFVPDERREAAALGALEYSPFFTDSGNFARALTFENAKPVYFKPYTSMGADGYRSTAFRDLDGSVTGLPRSSVVIDEPFLVTADCVRFAAWHAAACPAAFGSLFVSNVDAVPRASGPLKVSRVEGDGASLLLTGNPHQPVSVSFQTSVRGDELYKLEFNGALPRHLRLTLRHLGPGEGVTLELARVPKQLFFYQARDFSTPASRLVAYQDGREAYVRLAATSGEDGIAVVDVCAKEGC